MNMYTYEVATIEMGGWCDEIDVKATSQREADRLARIEADEMYGEDAVLTPIEPGGSGGLVQILKFV